MNKEIILTKVQTKYAVEHTDFVIHSTEEVKPYISVSEYGEPCSGVLKHWGTPDEIIAECEQIIKIVKAYVEKN